MNFDQYVACCKVDSPPVLSDNAGNKTASFKVTVFRRQQQSNGQWVDSKFAKLPVYVMDSKKAEMGTNHLVAGQEVIISGHLQTWGDNDESWGVIMTSIELGFKPRTDGGGGGGRSQSGPGGPPLPF